jgi:hypothetical protein
VDDAVRVALESGLPYSGLRGFVVDPRMWHYVPHRTARALQVVPVTIIGDRLQLASAVPSPDLGPVLRHFPALAVDIVIAPATEIDRVLNHARGSDA